MMSHVFFCRGSHDDWPIGFGWIAIHALIAAGLLIMLCRELFWVEKQLQ